MLFFAALRDRVGVSERRMQLPLEVRTIAELGAHLQRELPQLDGRLGSVRFALNEQFVEPAQSIAEGDVVALIPPVSGG